MSKSQQNYLDQVAQRLHLTADAQSGILFGMQGGLHMMLMRSTSNQNFVSLVFSLTHSGQEPDAAEIKAFVKSNKLIVNYSIRRSRVEFILKPRFGSFKQIDQLEQVTGEVVSLLRTGGYQSCCQNCGQTADTDACIMAGVPSLLCDSCYQQLGHNQEQIQQESAGKPENVLAGVVGALLGCLLGVGCIVLLGQLGYVAALSGIVLAVCTLKGYELLGGRLSTKGIVIACVLMLAMTYVGYRLDWAITVAKYFEASLTDSYRAIPYLIDEEILDGGVYTGELIKLYAFTLIGAIPTIIRPEDGQGDLSHAEPESCEQHSGVLILGRQAKDFKKIRCSFKRSCTYKLKVDTHKIPGCRKTVKSKNGENLVFSRGGVTKVTPFSFSSAHSEECKSPASTRCI